MTNTPNTIATAACTDASHFGCVDMNKAFAARTELIAQGDVVSMMRVHAIDRRVDIELYEICYHQSPLANDCTDGHIIKHFDFTGESDTN